MAALTRTPIIIMGAIMEGIMVMVVEEAEGVEVVKILIIGNAENTEITTTTITEAAEIMIEIGKIVTVIVGTKEVTIEITTTTTTGSRKSSPMSMLTETSKREEETTTEARTIFTKTETGTETGSMSPTTTAITTCFKMKEKQRSCTKPVKRRKKR